MAFEPLDAETAAFFESGHLPDPIDAPNVQPTPEAEAPAPVEQADVVADPTPVESSVEAPVFDQPPPNPYYERALAKQEAWLEKIQGQLEALTAPKTVEVNIDPTIDPLGALMQQQERIQKQIADFQQKQENDALNRTQVENQKAITKAVTDQVAAFEKQHSDYPDAFKHVVNSRLQQYKVLGYNAQEAQDALSRDNDALIIKALQTGKNPAQIVYALAKQYGYKEPAPAPDKVEKTLETIRKGQEASKTLERGTPQSHITASSLKDLSEAELNKVVRDDWDGIFGRTKGEI